MTDAILGIAAVFAAVAALVFCVLYARTKRGKRRLWWETQTGRSIMALGASITVLALGSVLRLTLECDNTGEAILTGAYVATGSVMIWRTVMMWRANHPEPPKEA